MPRDSLGDFEQLVLLAILRLRDDAYGLRIREEIEDRARRTASLGTVYTALERLERKKLVSSWTGGATPERGGRSKRFFKVEAAGRMALKQSLSATKRMTAGVEALVGGLR
jgi:PadR family transcriptional regulator, regulatory protein PadR